MPEAFTMSNHAIDEALKRANGANFYKCALQVNPFHYMKTFRGKDHVKYPDEESYNRALIQKAVELNIKVLAITDHNHVGSVEKLANLASENGIIVFPGFEIESSEGVHIICIFDVGTPVAILERYLGQLGIVDPSFKSNLSTKTLTEICKTVSDSNGIAIAAHITESKGLLHTMKSQAAIKAWNDLHLYAVQIPGSVDTLPLDKKPIVENKNADYKREESCSKKYACAVINCKDVAEPDDLNDPSATCNIKMSSLTIGGLRQAFFDPDSRIRLNSDLPISEHKSLIAFCADGGFLGNLTIKFNSDLNVLIGGRGAGKSSIIEAIRYTLGVEPLGQDAKDAHSAIIKEVIRSGTSLSLLVFSPSPSPRQYLIERTAPNPPVVKSLEGAILQIKPIELLKGIEIFGQHEIGDLTKDPAKITHLLSRFIDDGEILLNRRKDILFNLSQLRGEIIQKINQRKSLKEKVDRLPVVEEELKRFAEAGVEEKLKGKSELIEEEAVIDAIKEAISNFGEDLVNLSQSIETTESPVDENVIKKLPGYQLLEKMNTEYKQSRSVVLTDIKDISVKVEATKKALEKLVSDWNGERKEKVELEFSKILKSLQKDDVDADTFVSLKREAEELKPSEDRYKQIDKDLRTLNEKRAAFLDQLQKSLQEEFQSEVKVAKKISRNLSNLLSVEVEFLGNRQPIISVIREKVGGRLSEIEKAILGMESFSTPAFVTACRGGIEELKKYISVTDDQARRLIEKGEDLFLSLEEVVLTNTTNIKLNIAPPSMTAEWKIMDKLSKGQKATALLLLLLQETDAPLIIDQPEDDLDNQFIAEGIVPRMREEKRRRQFIFSTHNANLPVLGDAELIVALQADGEASGGKINMDRGTVGSIDDEKVCENVKTILEGGKAAFETRRKKYRF